MPTADPTLSTLPGSLPGLLRRGAPVVYTHRGETHSAIVLDEEDMSNESEPDRRCFGIHGGPCGNMWLAELALDLTDPAGMDIAARWLAEKVGLTVRSTAPRWERSDRAGSQSSNPKDPAFWWLAGSGLRDHQFHDFEDWPHFKNRTRLPGIGKITNPAESLRLACLTLGAPNA
jgi:hypothetical protein